MSALRYQLLHRCEESAARLGRVMTPHGEFDTPAFMPVGTQATIKGILPDRVAGIGAQIILGNTYHLMLRPGSALIRQLGGLHNFMQWNAPILTDSGGFQVFSLASINHISDDGVRFKSHLDGAMIDLTPERSMQVQNELGADIIMAFDDCPPARELTQHQREFKASRPLLEHEQSKIENRKSEMSYESRVRIANERTLRWLDRCVKAHGRSDEQALFGIVQGGVDLDQRDWCVQRVTQHDLPGYAIGGVAVGEPPEEIVRVVEHTAKQLPGDRPRYLMGVGYERDIVAAVRAGVDMFDCVLPTRNGRNANAFTPTGPIRLRNACFKDDPRPIDETCDCPTCAGVGTGGAFGRAYLRHLFMADEMLGGILVSLHNLRHFQRLMLDIRTAIRDNAWAQLRRNWPVAFADAQASSGPDREDADEQ